MNANFLFPHSISQKTMRRWNGAHPMVGSNTDYLETQASENVAIHT